MQWRPEMENTKERILIAALKLFAKDGYEAASASMIAGRLGIAKGALYRHYKTSKTSMTA
jgi:AcrR family transcriptional regulator